MPNQKQRPQEEKPKPIEKVPGFQSVLIDPVDDVLEELNNVKEEEQNRCGCWGSEKSGF
jgi:hypothetical protein